MEAVTRPHRRIYQPIRSAAINAAMVPEEIRELRSSSHDFYFHYDESLSRAITFKRDNSVNNYSAVNISQMINNCPHLP